MEAEYSIVHFAVTVGCDLPPPKSQHSREECGLALPALAVLCTWAQPVGFQIRCWWMKLYMETFPFCCLCSSTAAALRIREFHGIDSGWFCMWLNTHKLSRLSVFFWLLTQSFAKKGSSGSPTATPWAHIQPCPSRRVQGICAALF